MTIMPHDGHPKSRNAHKVQFSVAAFAILLSIVRIGPTQTTLVAAQGRERSSPAAIESVEACRATLTGAGRSAAFAGTAIFLVISDSQGKVIEVKPLKVPDFFSTFVQVDEFRACLHF